METRSVITFPRVLLIMTAVTLVGCPGEMSYKRVEEPPAGAQIDAVASAFHAVIRAPRVRYLYPAPYQDVWDAIKRVMESVKETGTEPQFETDQEHGLFVLTLDHRDDIAKTMDNPNPIRIKGWREELRFELTRRPDDRTLVVLTRVVLGVPFNRRCPEYVDPCPNPILFQPEVSNGQIERWLLTKIQEEVTKPMLAKAIPGVPPSGEASVAAPSSETPTVAAPAPEPSMVEAGRAVIQPRSNRPPPTSPLSTSVPDAPTPAPASDVPVLPPSADQPADAATSPTAPVSTRVPDAPTPAPASDAPVPPPSADEPAPAPASPSAPPSESSAPAPSSEIPVVTPSPPQ